MRKIDNNPNSTGIVSFIVSVTIVQNIATFVVKHLQIHAGHEYLYVVGVTSTSCRTVLVDDRKKLMIKMFTLLIMDEVNIPYR